MEKKIGYSAQNGKAAADKKRGAVENDNSSADPGEKPSEGDGTFFGFAAAAQAFTKPESSLFSSMKEV